VKLNAALRVPAALGVKVTLTAQVLWGARTAAVQLLALMAKSLGLLPPMLTEAMVRSAVPALVTVSVNGSLVAPTVCELKERTGAEKLAQGPVTVVENFVTNALIP